MSSPIVFGHYTYAASNDTESNIQSGLSLPGEYKYICTKFHVKVKGENICNKSLNQYIKEYSGSLYPPNVTDGDIDKIDWKLLITKTNTNKSRLNGISIKAELSKEILADAVKSSMKNKQLPFIATIVNKDNEDHIEWIKIIHIKSCNLYIAAAFKYVYTVNDDELVHDYCREFGNVPQEIAGITLNYYQRKVTATKIGLIQTDILDKHSLLATPSVTERELAVYRPWVTEVAINEDVEEDMEVVDGDNYSEFIMPPWD